MHRASDELLQQVKLAEEEDHPDQMDAYDDVSGAPFDPAKIYASDFRPVQLFSYLLCLCPCMSFYACPSIRLFVSN